MPRSRTKNLVHSMALIAAGAATHSRATIRRDDSTPRLQDLSQKAAPLEPSPKGEPVHPVFRFHALQTVDGRKPRSTKRATSFKGIVTRLNYAKHGVPNGVVLNTGDFIHMRPRGFGAVGLKIGDAIKATGKATKMARGGAVVEATEVNGVSMDR